MEPFTRITSRVVPLPNDNVDTDIIVPARFLKVTDKAGMDQYLFRDWRFDAAGNPIADFILNQPRARGAQILLTIGDTERRTRYLNARDTFETLPARSESQAEPTSTSA